MFMQVFTNKILQIGFHNLLNKQSNFKKIGFNNVNKQLNLKNK